jgi:hypothetical protein
MTTHQGGCHCGNIAVAYDSAIPAAEAVVRACQCRFCRKHQSRSVSDPAGAAHIRVHDEGLLSRYRFGHGTADYIVCARCGVYVGAACEVDGRLYAVLMINAFDDHAAFTQPPQPYDYTGEESGARLTRRQARWTPATLTVG